ncbi:hypothetical protein AAMO2058_000626600 [Amorphochlora amoebiformis]|mmetsp:Transcript_22672/g.35609  ORF Transcript_22672/g.35609 Transcript_22672/m.35609 type:complete len:558 (-) Transcript_22672:29-1702(-)
MSDVKDILGLRGAKPLPTQKAPAKKDVNPLTKGLAREVRNLLGDRNGPGLGIALQAQQFKARRSRKSSWKLQKIRSSARRALIGKEEDDLEIFHWVKIHNVPDYRFAKWNKSLKMLQYTDAEYEKHLRDPKWSKAETDRLFSLCKQFDLRFLVIHDRFNPIIASIQLPPMTHITHEGFPWAAQAERVRPSAPPPPEASDTTQEAEVEEFQPCSSTPCDSQKRKKSRQTSKQETTSTTSQPHPTQVASSSSAMDIKELSPADTRRKRITRNCLKKKKRTNMEEQETQEYRSMEELKSRYYDCQKLLLQARCVADGGKEEDVSNHPIFQNIYDGEHDRIRREQMELLIKRTPEQEKEISSTILETRKLDQKIRRVRKQLDALKKNPRAALSMIQRAKKSSGGSGSSRRAILARKTEEVVSTRDGPRAPIPKECKVEDMFPPYEQGCQLSSIRPGVAPQLRGRVYKQLESELMALGFSYASARPFTVPTKKVCDLYDNLRLELVTLINLNKYLVDREKELERLKASIRAQNKTVPPPPSVGSKREHVGELTGSSSKRPRK